MNLLSRYGFMTWGECMEARTQLREDLVLGPDEEEDKRACRLLYHIYFNNLII
jgi:hypothetical protein